MNNNETKRFAVTFNSAALDGAPVKHLGVVEIISTLTDEQVIGALVAAEMMSQDNRGLVVGEWNENLEVWAGPRLAWVLQPV